MTYQEGLKKMRSLIGETGTFNVQDNICINYPGRFKPGDYRVTYENGIAPTHAEIASMLSKLVTENSYTFQELKEFLDDVYTNGTNTIYDDTSLENLKHLIYWTTLQEEINYPRAKGYAGIKLPFCRYFEAIYSTLLNSPFTIDEVIRRCNNHNQSRPELYSFLETPIYYSY